MSAISRPELTTSTDSFQQKIETSTQCFKISREARVAAEILKEVKDHRLPNGAIYSGQILNELPHGEGELHSKNGTVYKGGFRHGLRQGQCTFRFSKGVYQGDVENDNWHGRGKFTLDSGEIIEGLFVNGVFQGKLTNE